MVVTVAFESDAARAALDAATAQVEDGPAELVAVPQTDGDYSPIGLVVRVEQQGPLPGGANGVVLRGLRRVSIGRGETDADGVLFVSVTELPDEPPTEAAKAFADQYREVATELLRLIGGGRMTGILDGVDDPGALADTLGWWPDLGDDRRLELFETTDTTDRIIKALAWAKEALAEAQVATDVASDVSAGLEDEQRKAILRRQMESIRKELGESDDDAVAEYRTKLAEADLPEAVAAAVEKELDRLERMGEQSMESGWIRTWLDTVFELPWNERTDDAIDLDAAQAQLDADHTGLEKVKERIVEFLAVRKRRRDRAVDAPTGRGSGTIVALVGPPGVGKTSLGQSIADTMGREFVRMSLGGVRDEAEIRGHRRTYVGARPGRIVRALIDAGTMNPVILLDEIDKVGADWRGDPSSALLEVLDPEQNSTFRDHYLETELDLSDVVFIATANVLDTIPAPLLDRMEIIPIEGYTEDEKVAIARDHLLPRLLERNAIEPGEVVISDAVIRTVVGDYTREAGVRRLEQRLDRLVRRAVSELVKQPELETVEIGDDDLRPALGRTAPRDDPAERTVVPGIATGLAVTGAGGDVLFVEVSASDGEPGLTLTGQLGDVMKESGQIVLSYLRANAAELGLDATATEAAGLDRRFHVHFPAGAVPKDGPSAGVTMTTAFVSLLRDQPMRSDVAMTGEVTLHGRVLPIGGVKEKVLAAHRANVKHVILPEGNREDTDDIPEHVLDDIELHFASTVKDVLDVALAA
ncbi:MAG: endopeptidase La [Acidimicrobiales bacterium]|nr:endopeptidase La [Acidimicrobiales bacterium]